MKKPKTEIQPYVIVYHSLNEALKEGKLFDTDLLVYVYLRKWMDKDSFESDLSYSQLSKQTGYSDRTVKDSIKRLEDNNFITSHQRLNKSKVYKFTRLEEHFESFLFELLEKDESIMSPKLKAFIIAIRKFLIERDGQLVMSSSPTEISNFTGLSLNTVKERMKELTRCEGIKLVVISKIKKGNDYYAYNLAPKDFGLVLVKQQEKIIDHEDRLSALEKRFLELEKENKILKEQLINKQLIVG